MPHTQTAGNTIHGTIRGSTTIRELMERFPHGRALDLMARLGWPCGHCGARSTEPLSLAAKRHGNPVRAVIACFRMLEDSGPTEAALNAARPRPRRSPDPAHAWLRSAARYGRGGGASERAVEITNPETPAPPRTRPLPGTARTTRARRRVEG